MLAQQRSPFFVQNSHKNATDHSALLNICQNRLTYFFNFFFFANKIQFLPVKQEHEKNDLRNYDFICPRRRHKKAQEMTQSITY